MEYKDPKDKNVPNTIRRQSRKLARAVQRLRRQGCTQVPNVKINKGKARVKVEQKRKKTKSMRRRRERNIKKIKH